MPSQPISIILSLPTIFFSCLLIILTISQTPIGTACIFQEGQKMNCRQYCLNYFKQQPQLGWYNATSHQCEPAKICSWYFHYFDYATNECYTDRTMQTIGPSQYPQTLNEDRIATFYIDQICVNGVSESGTFNDGKCFCYFLWENSGKVDLNGYPYKCDQVIGPQKWKGYFLKETIKAPNGTILAYGQYTPEQLQVVYENMKEKQASQTAQFVYKYQDALLDLIQNQLPQQSLIRQHEYIWVLITLGIMYLIFAFSYLRERNLRVKVTRKQLIKRIQDVLNQNSAVYSGQ